MSIDRTYHIHIYKIESLAEVEIDDPDGDEALRRALALKETLNYKKPDNKYLALCFDWDLTCEPMDG